jgi:hypothetical protein
VHVSLPATADGPAALVASMPVKPGNATTYVLDVTDAVNALLGRLDGTRTLRLEVRITGKPLPYEVYGLPVAAGHTQPTLEVVSEPAWHDDWDERIAPLTTATIYREACLPLVEDRAAEAVVQLLYPARRIIEVVCNLTGEKLEAGRDYDLRDGLLVLRAGNPAIQFAPEFFAVERKGRDGAVTTSRNAIQLMEGTWYQERQLEVTYEPVSRDWNMPTASSSLADLPRTRRLLEAKEPLRLILFGDSILSYVVGYQGFFVIRKQATLIGEVLTVVVDPLGAATAHTFTGAVALAARRAHGPARPHDPHDHRLTCAPTPRSSSPRIIHWSKNQSRFSPKTSLIACCKSLVSTLA